MSGNLFKPMEKCPDAFQNGRQNQKTSSENGKTADQNHRLSSIPGPSLQADTWNESLDEFLNFD